MEIRLSDHELVYHRDAIKQFTDLAESLGFYVDNSRDLHIRYSVLRLCEELQRRDTG